MKQSFKLQREALDKMDGMICDGFQDAGDDCDSLSARLEQVESQLKQLPEADQERDPRSSSRCGRAARPDASRRYGYSRGGYGRHKAAAGRREQVHEDDQRARKASGREIRETEGVAARRCQEAQPVVQHAPRSLRPRQCKTAWAERRG